MLTTILGSLLGFITSFAPDVLEYFQDGRDKAHELAVLDRQIERDKLQHEHRIREIETEADVAQMQAIYEHDMALRPRPGGLIAALRASVRPTITYAFFLLFAAVKLSGLWVLITVEGMLLAQALPAIWDAETEALFAAILSFWFGRRALEKAKDRRA